MSLEEDPAQSRVRPQLELNRSSFHLKSGCTSWLPCILAGLTSYFVRIFIALFSDELAATHDFSDRLRFQPSLNATNSDTSFWEFSQTAFLEFLKFPAFILPAFSHVSAIFIRESSNLPSQFGNFRQSRATGPIVTRDKRKT